MPNIIVETLKEYEVSYAQQHAQKDNLYVVILWHHTAYLPVPIGLESSCDNLQD